MDNLKTKSSIENITIGQIAKAFSFIVGIIVSLTYLTNMMGNSVNTALEPLTKKIETVEMNTIKTELVNYMSIAESKNITAEQKINAYELYDRYKELGGNSYIHDKWEKLQKEGKL